ncbi:MAG: TAXI family TRAP transporter solute-binding subunit [Alphaproteobacteria bacterium]|nr:TAXI family TRAP transporter solute-binding subunit [Alphaproteobacteria bacterium]
MLCRLLILTVLLALAAGPVSSAPRPIVVGGGIATGTNVTVATSICSILNTRALSKFKCTAIVTLGSAANVDAVSDGTADYALAQADVVSAAENGEEAWKDHPVRALRAMLALHYEAVTLVTRLDSGIDRVADLRQRAVNIGNLGSGGRIDAERLLCLHTIDPVKDIKPFDCRLSDVSQALTKGKLDAFFSLSATPLRRSPSPPKRCRSSSCRSIRRRSWNT